MPKVVIFAAILLLLLVSWTPAHESLEVARLEAAGVKFSNVPLSFLKLASGESTWPAHSGTPFVHESVSVPVYFPHLEAWTDQGRDLLKTRFTTSQSQTVLFMHLDNVIIIRFRGSLTLSDGYDYDALVGDLSKLRKMTSLSASFTPLTDRHVALLSESTPHLLGLQLGGCFISNRGVEHIGKFQQLRCLDLSDTLASNQGIQPLEGLKDLRQLSLGGCNVSDDALASLITALPKLEMVFLHGTPSGVKTIEALSRHQAIRVVDLSYTAVTDDMVQQLLVIPNLEELYLEHNQFTLAAFRRVGDARKLNTLVVGESLDELASAKLFDAHPQLSQGRFGILRLQHREEKLKPDAQLLNQQRGE
jgi:hypothetical protein